MSPPATRSRAAAAERPMRIVEREARFLGGDLRRVGWISGACLLLLALLVVVDRVG